MDFDLALNVLCVFGACSVTAIGLEWLFPAPATNPSADSLWIQLFGALVQLTVFLGVAPSLANAINPSNYGGEFGPQALVWVFGLLMQPNLINKVMAWYGSIQNGAHAVMSGNAVSVTSGGSSSSGGCSGGSCTTPVTSQPPGSG